MAKGKDFTLAGYTVRPGERCHGSLGSVGFANGARVPVPFVAINGKEPGVVLTVLAGIHGPEVVGIGSLIRILKELDPATLRGTFVAVTAANPLVVHSGTYVSEIDRKNLSNTVMDNAPPDGTISDRVGAYLSVALRASDLVIDLHACPFPSIPVALGALAVCKDQQTKDRVLRMIEAFGITRLYSFRPKPANLRDFCCQEGVAAITPELSDGLHLMPDNTEVGLIGVKNVMKAFGMLDGALEKQKVKVLEGDGWRTAGKLKTNTGGFMFPLVEPGDLVPAGTPVAELYDVYGALVEQVKIPFRGAMYTFTGSPSGTYALSEGTEVGYTFCHKDDFDGRY